MNTDVDTPPSDAPAFARVGSVYYPILVAVFTACVIISNVTATKGVAFGPIITDGGFIVFPLTYIIGDVLAEVYGFRAARRAIIPRFPDERPCRAGVLGDGLSAGRRFLPQPGALRQRRGRLHPVDRGRAWPASSSGQTINAWTVVKIKEHTKEKHLWARLVGSTFAGQLGDTLVFCSIAANAIGITHLR